MEDTEKIYTECITALDRDTIINSAKRDEETLLGFLFSYLVAERILKYFSIEM